MTLAASGHMNKLKELSARTYKEQGCFCLNAHWDTWGKDEGENVWGFVAKMTELDEKNGADGSELDELTAHRFLESTEQTLTVRELRDVLREIDVDTNKMVSMAEYLIYKYKIDWKQLVDTVQGNKEEVTKAQALVSNASNKLDVSRDAQNAAKTAEAEARHAEGQARNAEAAAIESENQAKDAEAAARAAEADAKAATAEAEVAKQEAEAAEETLKIATAALVDAESAAKASADSLAAEEKANEDRLSALEAASNSGGIVARRKAANELAQAKTEDPLPLRRAKTTADAAHRAAEKAAAQANIDRENARIATKAVTQKADTARTAEQAATVAADAASAGRADAEASRAEAEASRHEAEASRADAVIAREASDDAVAEAEAAFQAAEDYLEKAKNTIPEGSIWWLERELEEKKKFLPQSKGGSVRN